MPVFQREQAVKMDERRKRKIESQRSKNNHDSERTTIRNETEERKWLRCWKWARMRRGQVLWRLILLVLLLLHVQARPAPDERRDSSYVVRT